MAYNNERCRKRAKEREACGDMPIEMVKSAIEDRVENVTYALYNGSKEYCFFEKRKPVARGAVKELKMLGFCVRCSSYSDRDGYYVKVKIDRWAMVRASILGATLTIGLSALVVWLLHQAMNA